MWPSWASAEPAWSPVGPEYVGPTNLCFIPRLKNHLQSLWDIRHPPPHVSIGTILSPHGNPRIALNAAMLPGAPKWAQRSDSLKNSGVLWSPIWVCSPRHSKANLLTQVVLKESVDFTVGWQRVYWARQVVQAANAQKAWTSQWVSGRHF